MKSTVVVLLAISLTHSLKCSAEEFATFHENVLGTSLELRIEANTQAAAAQAEQVALREIDRLSKIFSHYDPNSELSTFLSLPTGSAMRVSSELYETLRKCDEWRRLSGGAFNPAVEQLSRQWQDCAANGALPDASTLDETIASLKQPHWKVEDGDQQQVVRQSHLPLSLNAIAKGVILDRAAASVLASDRDTHGIMLNLGGDIRAAGAVTVHVEIANPAADAVGGQPISQVRIHNAAVATSGKSERYFEIAGERYSHIFDPRSGRPVTEIVSSTVVAQEASTADVVATICSVLSMADSLRLVNSLPNVECLLVSAGGAVMTSANWAQAGQPPSDRTTGGTTIKEAQQPINAKTPHEMLVQFKIGTEEKSSRYRRPYVAVWIEDQDNFPVKTLSLFLMQDQPGPRWYRDLRRWYADDQLRLLVDKSDLIATVSKPTRNPGEYKVTWDGRDDTGELLPNGEYALLIEAAREHGTYQLIKHPFKLGGPAFEEKLKGNAEISAASVNYKFTK